MRQGKLVRGVVAVAATGLLWGAAACSGGGGEDDAPAEPTEEERDGSGADAARTGTGITGGPGTPDDARALARAVAIEPGDYGPGFVAADLAEADPATVAVLDEACVWQREPLPDGVLANVTRNAELPAQQQGGGPLQAMSSVTVHDSIEAADARMAGIVEEVLRCPQQQLRADEYVTGLGSSSMPPDQLSVDDQIAESGQFHSEVHGGPYDYYWLVSRIGPVTVAVSAKGAAGVTEDQLSEVSFMALALLESNAEAELR
ncbi:hypothetical protein [Streptomyces sp. MP131-18]|uniref:hypothetical protein n=1 Tax=Streptomyces sp. MP131-18 TaxID=1857892 RepID=UPI0009A1D7D4|nr:hypothetical protein [Streptomyces sp. MP131-18]ONK14610.1 hypothetical protein STBA_53950 [Streptomyces sp. MP131-18]